jgi:general secretion pathway protein N
MSVQGAKVFSAVLAGACGVLLLLAFALQVGFGRGYHWLAPDEDATNAAGAVAIDREPFKLPPETAFVETTERPIFNEDRKPTPETAPEDVKPPPPSVPLNVNLTGVILTPQVHLAMLHDNAKNEAMSVREGMPLSGDLGGWTLTKVKPRSALFKDSSGEEVEVELSTAVASPKPGSNPPRPGGVGPAQAGANQAPTQQFGPKPPPPAAKGTETAQAEQMQRRIEERRKQMRDEAERLKQQQSNPQH